MVTYIVHIAEEEEQGGAAVAEKVAHASHRAFLVVGTSSETVRERETV